MGRGLVKQVLRSPLLAAVAATVHNEPLAAHIALKAAGSQGAAAFQPPSRAPGGAAEMAATTHPCACPACSTRSVGRSAPCTRSASWRGFDPAWARPGGCAALQPGVLRAPRDQVSRPLFQEGLQPRAAVPAWHWAVPTCRRRGAPAGQQQGRRAGSSLPALLPVASNSAARLDEHRGNDAALLRARRW